MALLAMQSDASAQRVTGPFADATVVPKGMVRFGIAPTWQRANERFSNGLAGRPAGTREPLGADAGRDSITPALFEPLRTVAQELATLTGSQNLPLTLGRLRVDLEGSSVTTPISLEYGFTRRLTLGVMVPYISTRSEVFANPNPSRSGGTLGINPALSFAGARTQNAAVVAQIAAAASALRTKITACTGSSAADCAAINADPAAARALATSADAVARGIANVYGTQAGEGSRYSPVAGSPVQSAVSNRLGGLATSFAALLGAPSSGTSWIVARPVGAPLLAYEDLNTVLTDPEFGIEALPFTTVELKRLGDVEVGAKFLLIDAFGGAIPHRATPGGVRARVSIGGVYRFASGQLESSDDFVDIGTGDGQSDIEGSLYTDLLVGRRFWMSAVARYGLQQKDAQVRRVPLVAGEPFTAKYRQGAVYRDLGDYLAAELSPRFVLSDAVMLSANYSFYRKGEDSYTGTLNAANLEGEFVDIDASALNAGTSRQEQRLLGALTYSTVAAYHQRRATLPVEVNYMIGRTLAGNGNVPASFYQSIGIRVYARLFGADSRPPRARR